VTKTASRAERTHERRPNDAGRSGCDGKEVVLSQQAVEKLTVRAGFIPPHTMCNPLLPEDSDEEKQEKQT
jgi:hypothetical protein